MRSPRAQAGAVQRLEKGEIDAALSTTEPASPQPRLTALKIRDTARSISATDYSLRTKDVGYELERLAGAVTDVAAIVASMARAGR